MRYTLPTILVLTAFTQAAPISRRQIRLDDAATAEAQQRDNDATRAFSAVQIKTSSGQCLTIDETTGDFRRNLQLVRESACTNAPTQQWDFITAGLHNDQPGTTLIVSTAFSSCLNFDDRRADGNKVITFSCGGRADGGGRVTDSQLFEFSNTTATSLPLVPSSGKGGICFEINGGQLDRSDCQSSNPATNQIFTIGDAAPAAPAPTPDATSPAAEPNTPAETAAPAPPAAPTGSIRLDEAATAQAQQRDNGATRAFANVPIKTSSGQCLTIDVNTGDFRRNLQAIRESPCTGDSTQQFDFITAGAHNDQPGTTLIVSSAFSSCLNFDDRRADGNKVLTFSCGGRADGEGRVTDSQLFGFEGAPTSLALTPVNGRGAVCFMIVDGTLDIANCDANSADQVFTIGDATAAPPANPNTNEPAPSESSSEAGPAPSEAPTQQPGASSKGSVALDEAATAQAQQRDNGKSLLFYLQDLMISQASNGQCLTVNLDTGDFRQNLMEVALRDCVAGLDTQQWDVITAGKHNDQAGKALIVSTLTNGCLNVDERRQPGNQVLLFSCGGRADGEGGVTNSQLFAFDGKTANIPLVPGNVSSQCVVASNGKLDIAQCDAANPNSDQTFSIA
ncbi:hypothetical protein BKA62DRAFT_771631 [Auriculariales sp. MPI-PUGE-AT-0066]|nr:hypothetical protein BKA62DRAFT_771631 [Auriculariales sp. MPI-PUGE-AT-0066]